MSGVQERVELQLSVAIRVEASASSAVLRSAEIIFLDLAAQPPMHLSADGYQVFTRVAPGLHRVKVTAQGFEPLETSVQVAPAPDQVSAAIDLSLVNAKNEGIR